MPACTQLVKGVKQQCIEELCVSHNSCTACPGHAEEIEAVYCRGIGSSEMFFVHNFQLSESALIESRCPDGW